MIVSLLYAYIYYCFDQMIDHEHTHTPVHMSTQRPNNVIIKKPLMRKFELLFIFVQFSVKWMAPIVLAVFTWMISYTMKKCNRLLKRWAHFNVCRTIVPSYVSWCYAWVPPENSHQRQRHAVDCYTVSTCRRTVRGVWCPAICWCHRFNAFCLSCNAFWTHAIGGNFFHVVRGH